MKSPFTGKEMPLLTRTELMTFRKESFNIVYNYYYCEDSGEEFVSSELGDLNLNQLYNQYRAKHHIPFPEEIKRIRQDYDLPANKMAEVLGLGTNMYRNYEAGEIPSESNSRLIIAASDPKKFRDFLLLTNSISEKEKDRTLRQVDQLIVKERKYTLYNLEEYVMGVSDPNEFTGYKAPSLSKALQVIIFFAQELKPWLTSLNKLLFYTDFGHYKHTGNSITGMSYRAINYGVVPSNYGKLFAEAVDQEIVDVRYKEFVGLNAKDTYFGQQYLPAENVKFDEHIFSEAELITLKKVSSLFSGKNTDNIVQMNHQEKAWLENFDKRQLVSYQYSFDLHHI